MARGGEVNKSGNLQDGAWRRYSWWPERMTPRALCVLYPSSSPSSSSSPPPPPSFFSHPPHNIQTALHTAAVLTLPGRRRHCEYIHTHHIIILVYGYIRTRLLLLL